MERGRVLVWLAACLAGTGSVFAADRGSALVLVSRGSPNARIVLPSDAEAEEKLAAQELAAYMQRITGAALSITTDPAAPGAKVLVGLRDRAARDALRLDQLKYGGFVMKREGEVLTLAGRPAVGTLNAVYAFLEDVAGVRWYMPTELGENVPTRPTLSVAALDRRVEPRFVNRRNHGIDLSIRGEGEAWRRRVRITSHGLDVPFNRYSHNLYRVLPVDHYAAAHPEYFPLRKGKRYIAEGRAKHSAWQPCTTNPDVVGIAIRYGRKWLDEQPRTNFYSVGMNDSRGFCECPKCKALDAAAREFRGREMVSDRYFTFVKAVADEIAKTHPDRYVSCIAYSAVESLPEQVKIPSNVYVVITQDVAQWHDPEYRRTDEAFARSWAEAAGAFGTYDYTGLTWLLPRVYPHLMAESLRLYAEVGAVAVTNEAFPTWWYAAPQMYLRAKLLWDPQRDADAVLDEFYRGFFGPARKPMKGVYDVFERCMVKPREGRWFEGLSSVIQQLDLWTPQDAAECRRLLSEAKGLAGAEGIHARRVAFVARGWGWIDQVLEEYWQAQKVERLASDPQAATEQVLDEALKLMRHTERRERTWQAIRSDRLLSGIYRLIDERYARRWASWKAYLNKCQTIGFTSVTSVEGDARPERIRRLLAMVPQGPLAAEFRGHLWVAEHPRAANLCRNPGFEDAQSAGPAPKGIDWVATQCPPGWSKWALERPSRDRMTWEAKAGRRGSRCVRTQGAKNACFIQTSPVKPGERYYASVAVRAKCSPDAKSQLRVQWKDAEGKWIWSSLPRVAQAQGSTDRARGRGPWRGLSLVFTVPEGVGQAVLLLTVLDQQAEDATWFDDVRVVRVPPEPE